MSKAEVSAPTVLDTIFKMLLVATAPREEVSDKWLFSCLLEFSFDQAKELLHLAPHLEKEFGRTDCDNTQEWVEMYT